MGIHSINSFMKSMATQAEIEGKKLTNHSARKTLVKKLKAANQPRSAIIGVTGHTSERSLADYEEGDENEQRLISSIISSEPQASTLTQRRPLESATVPTAVANTLMMNEEKMMTVSHFHGCRVTINYHLQFVRRFTWRGLFNRQIGHNSFQRMPDFSIWKDDLTEKFHSLKSFY